MAEPRHRFRPPNAPCATLTRSTGSPVALCNRGSGIRLAGGFTQELRMGHLPGESMLAATISAEEVERMFRNGLLLGDVGRRGRPSKSSSAKDDDGRFAQFHSARPSKRSWIESLIEAGYPQIEGFIPESFTTLLKLKGNRQARRANSIGSLLNGWMNFLYSHCSVRPVISSSFCLFRHCVLFGQLVSILSFAISRSAR
jgi:hypothetical protein